MTEHLKLYAKCHVYILWGREIIVLSASQRGPDLPPNDEKTIGTDNNFSITVNYFLLEKILK